MSILKPTPAGVFEAHWSQLQRGETPPIFDFAHQMASQEDIQLFFGPDYITLNLTGIDGHWTMAHVIASTGFMPSVGQARKAGWDIPIPPGWTDIVVGKADKLRRICILNEF